MIVNDEKKYIFVHVFRTGGSSVYETLCPATNEYEWHTRLEDVPGWQDYFSFGFVRNPWDRALSAYMYGITRGNIEQSFEEYVNEFTRPPKDESKKFAQYEMLKNCNFIGRFEYFQKDFNTICKMIGLPKKKLFHSWKTKHNRYTSVYTPEQIDIMDRASSGDIEHFGYYFKSGPTKNVGKIR